MSNEPLTKILYLSRAQFCPLQNLTKNPFLEASENLDNSLCNWLKLHGKSGISDDNNVF
ncbi:MAG: hypothetical protein F6K36_03870 [Symploca sp. SIO3C6]|nr:hypothetical protein [Symploca sp. SIO3C6]